MLCRVVKRGGVLAVGMFLAGCAAMSGTVNAPLKAPLEGKRVVVMPFQDPFYKGRQISGVGGPFATVFVTKLQAAGVLAEGPRTNAFTSTTPVELDKACKYATENRYDAVVTGTVTEWIDGATQWSGTFDVAAVTVTVYGVPACEPTGSASGRQNGQWFTFVDAPTTRFFAPLSEEVVASLLNKRTTAPR
jgi:hypothetical protein